MKKVAIVHELLHKLGGAERIVKIFADMFPEAPIYTLVYDENKVGSVFPKERVIPSRIQKYFKYIKKPQPFLTKMPYAIEMFDFNEYDLVISSSSAFAHGILTPVHTKHICYCHSPMRYAWDYTHEYRKEKAKGLFGKAKDWLISKSLHNIRQWDKIAADRPDLYLANSKAVQNRLKKYYGIDAEVLYPAVDTKRFSLHPEKDDYYLIVSALTPFKKVDLAIHAFNKLQKPLHIIGAGEHEKYLKSIAGNTIQFLGRLNDHEVKTAMEKARGFVFPVEDDFGITPVEAMACGTPVLAFKKGGALETVIEGKTGEFFEKQEVESLISALKRLENNFYSYDGAFMREHAERFSEDSFIERFNRVVTNTPKAICPNIKVSP